MARKALVVGGTSGIGHGIALNLASLGTDVTIAGRSATAGAAIVTKMKELSPNNEFKFEPVDGFSMTDCAALAQKITTLDYLVMSQGMATIQGFTPTQDGFDQKLSLHVYSRFLLSKLLAPKLAQSNDGRVLSVLSAGVHSAYTQPDLSLKTSYSIPNAANAGGMYNDVFLEKLAASFPNVIFTHAAPGFVNTNWGTEMPALLRCAIRPLQSLFGKDFMKCGEAMVGGMMKGEKGRLNLVDPEGGVGKATLSKGHEENKERVYEHLVASLGPFC